MDGLIYIGRHELEGTPPQPGAVVSKDVAPYTIVAGVPATPIRRRFEPAVADALEALAWWDWPHEKNELALEDFRELDVEAFIEKYG